jgi:hypothetical protein
MFMLFQAAINSADTDPVTFLCPLNLNYKAAKPIIASESIKIMDDERQDEELFTFQWGLGRDKNRARDVQVADRAFRNGLTLCYDAAGSGLGFSVDTSDHCCLRLDEMYYVFYEKVLSGPIYNLVATTAPPIFACHHPSLPEATGKPFIYKLCRPNSSSTPSQMNVQAALVRGADGSRSPFQKDGYQGPSGCRAEWV